jgi:hypothetical protein
MAVAILLASFASAGAAQPAAGQILALPTPKAFVSYVDLECFKTNPYTPPLSTPITLTHLNPVLAQLPTWSTTLGVRSQLCAPVAKNNAMPPTGVLDFVRYLDLSCYQITGPTVNFPLTISHLNPLLVNLPRQGVTMGAPTQLCVPVTKNNVMPPAEVLSLVRFVDLACFVTTPPVSLGISLQLTQLNPVLTGIQPAVVGVNVNRQLCVPVRKNGQQIPTDVLNIVRWLDLEKYDITTPALPTPVNLTLRHINPLLAGLPAEPAQLTGASQLALPMAKNGVLPPG